MKTVTFDYFDGGKELRFHWERVIKFNLTENYLSMDIEGGWPIMIPRNWIIMRTLLVYDSDLS